MLFLAVLEAEGKATTTVGGLPGFDETVLSKRDGHGEVDDSERLVEAAKRKGRVVRTRREGKTRRDEQDKDFGADRDGEDVSKA